MHIRTLYSTSTGARTFSSYICINSLKISIRCSLAEITWQRENMKLSKMRINLTVKCKKNDNNVRRTIKKYYNYNLVKIINLLSYMATHFHIDLSPSSICTWTFWIICLSVFRALCNWDEWICLLMLVLHKLTEADKVHNSITCVKVQILLVKYYSITYRIKVVKTDFYLSKSTEVLAFKST